MQQLHMLTPTRACNTFPPLFWLFVVQGQYVTCGMPTRQELQAVMGMHRREWAWIIDNHLPSDKLQVQRHPVLPPREYLAPHIGDTQTTPHTLLTECCQECKATHSSLSYTKGGGRHPRRLPQKWGV